MSEKNDNQLSYILINWYHQHKRDLPWRETNDPYLIWISEIILQQTRVAQGLDYYFRFVDRFPNVKTLAEAEEDEVLSYWQGLGYYSRARNLHHAAKQILSDYKGEFPQQHKEVLSLKGIGEYTAAAIVSFAFHQPYAVLDGNVFRVLSRIFAEEEPIDTGKGKKIFSKLAQDLLNKENPSTHNQAMMEFGALQCVPQNPDCEQCPLQSACLAFAKGLVNDLPRKQGKTTVKNRYFNYFDVRFEGKIFLTKRTGNDIWKNLYELPLIETDTDTSLEEILNSKEFRKFFSQTEFSIQQTIPQTFKHVLSHRIIYAKFYRIELRTNLPDSFSDFVSVDWENLSNYAISRLLSRYLETL